MRYWLFVILTLSLTAVVGMATYRTSQLLKQWIPDRNLMLLPSENAVRLGLISVCILLGLLSGLPMEQLGWTIVQWRAALIEGTIWGVLMATGFYLLTDWIAGKGDGKYHSSVVADAILPRDQAEFYWTFAAMIGVVLAEELLFRSLLLGGFEPIIEWYALLIVTSVIFGLFHLPQGAWGVTGAAIAGALLGALYLKTGSILAPISAHYITNMVQIWVAIRVKKRDANLGG